MTTTITPGLAHTRLLRVAAGITEASTAEAISRFLERLATRPDAEALRDALTVLGAGAVLREAQDGRATR